MKPLAIVTGATRGIGLAITMALLKNNFDVYFTYKLNKDLALSMEKNYPGCKSFCFDHEKDDIGKISEQILTNRAPDILINNVGIVDDKLFINQDLSEFWRIMKINFGSVVEFCKLFLNQMINRRAGQIINISSVAAIKPKIGNSAYGTAKAAVERFSKTLALESARFNVRVNCISPAYVKTDLFDSFLAKEDQGNFYKSIPMRKILLPEEIAELVVLLCMNKIHTTGSIFYVGNGENVVS